MLSKIRNERSDTKFLMYGSMEEHSFGYWLRLRRKALDLTQEGLADRVGCSAALIRKIESEDRRPSAQIVERLAEIFNMPMDERDAFFRFARGDWRAAPTGGVENAPWLGSSSREPIEPSHPITHLATFLFTDIEGSAKLWETAPEKMKIALQHHHAILQESIVSNGGSVFQIVGDAFCAAFPTVLFAMSAAITAQQELQREPWDLPFPIRVRMGIHTGEAERISNNEYASNPTLNRVARILSAAHGGQVLLSLATTDLVKDSLPVNTGLRDMGQHYLKNLIHPEHLFQLNIQGLPSEFPPLNTLTHRHNMPIQVTSFIGREKELFKIVELIAKNRLVTLTGAGGIGKTRLSIEAARRVLSEFQDGTFFVALAPLSDPNLIARTVVQALGFVEDGNRPAEQQLAEGIGDKRMLIVLDDCEHLIEGVAALASNLLSTCPYIKIIATSRESLRIPGEWLYAVPTLGIAPDENMPLDLETASKSPMLMLFTERARAVRSDFTLTKDNLQPVTSICMRLDGLPLAIELIAARIRLMSPQALLERLSGQFILTADGMRSTSERQKTLNNAIRWSYDLLPPAEQRLFVCLSIFSGGFTLEGAEKIFSDMFAGQSIAGLITSLLDKSLLQRAFDPGGEVRFQMLVTIKQFALNRLQDLGSEEESRNRHLAYFLDLAEKGDNEIRGPSQIEWVNRLEREHDNFRAALEWSVSSYKTESALRLLCALGWSWEIRGHYVDARNWLDKIRSLPDVNHHLAIYARLLNHVGRHSWSQNKLDDARSLLEESQAISLKLGDDGEQILAEALNWLGLVTRSAGEMEQTNSLFQRGLELYQKWGNRSGMALSTFHMGMVESDLGHDETALSLLQKSLPMFRQLGDLFFVARVSLTLGRLFLKQGKYDKAQLLFEDQLRIDKELQFWNGIAEGLGDLGNLCRYQGQYDQAAKYYEESIAVCREHGLNKYRIYYASGLLALHSSNYALAFQCFTYPLDLAQKSGELVHVSMLLMGLAAVAAGTNQSERAAKLSGAAQAVFEAIDDQIPQFDRAEFDRHIQFARAQLGDDAVESLQAEGRLMTMEQAIIYALEDED